jgi:hypothetical protein
MESYPVIPLFFHFVCISWIHYVFHCPKSKNYIENIPSLHKKLKYQESISFWFNIAYFTLFINERKSKCICNELPTAFINFILLLCIANWTTSNFIKRYQLKKLSLKQQIPILQNSSARESKCSC